MRALVTGGGGFLGGALVAALRGRGDEVIAVGRRTYAAATALGARCVVSDLTHDDPGLTEAMAGVDVVFHTAALPPPDGRWADYVAANVDGTRRTLRAAEAAGVPVFVHTSTPSVAFDGRPQHRVTAQQAPIPLRHLSAYAATKARAEHLALTAHRPGFAVTALRPRLMYGPGEPHMLPLLIARHAAGRLRQVGDGTNLASLTFLDNAVSAHLAAADALRAIGAAHPGGGQAFFVADAEPVALWPWIGHVLEAAGLPPLTRRVPARLAYGVGAVLEAVWRVLGRHDGPPMTRFAALNLSTTCTYDLAPLEAAFGWRPVVAGEDGLRATLAAIRAQARNG
jgi:nucleoside-diphosphate-sugar epimerase